jgi:hypothetical protein
LVFFSSLFVFCFLLDRLSIHHIWCFTIWWFITAFLIHFNWVQPGLLVGSVLLIILVFCVVLLCVFTFLVPCCDVRYDFRIKAIVKTHNRTTQKTKMMSNTDPTNKPGWTQLLAKSKQFLLHIRQPLCYSHIQHFFFVLCHQYSQLLWIIHSWLPLWVSLTFIHIRL